MWLLRSPEGAFTLGRFGSIKINCCDCSDSTIVLWLVSVLLWLVSIVLC